MTMHTDWWETRRILLIAALAGMILLAPRSAWAQMEGHHAYDTRRTVSVSGEGVVNVEPDMAIVHFGVVSIADDPEEARRQNADASSRAMNAVRELGIEDRHLRMESLRLQPHREWVDDQRRYVESGYEAIRQIVVEVHDLEQLPILVSTVVQQGANRLERVTYDIENRDQARNRALREAVNNAQEKASLVATTLGEELGPVHSITEQSFDFPRPMVEMRMDAAETAASAAPDPDAYAAGELEVRVNVQASFVLE